MWIIIVSDDQSESRNTVLDSILNTTKPIENYVSLLRNKYNLTSSIHFAKVWKTQSGAKRVLSAFQLQSDRVDWYKDKFYHLRRKHLHIRRMTKEEWNGIIDSKLNILDNTYRRQRSKLEQKKYK